MSYLKQHYHRLETSELLKLQASELTDEARVVLEEELRSREGTEDAVDSPTRLRAPDHVVDLSAIAPLWRRVAAAVIDYWGTLAVLMVVNFAAYMNLPKAVSDPFGYASLLLWFGYIVFKDAMARQSFGKRMLGLQVIDFKDGVPCSAPQSIARNLLHHLGVIDWAFAIGTHGRRLGDHVAGTYVVRAPA